jgi:hypothetical protein
MSRSSPKRALLSWLLRRLGPPPLPPRRYFSKSWSYDAHHRAVTGHGGAGRHRGAGPPRPAAQSQAWSICGE